MILHLAISLLSALLVAIAWAGLLDRAESRRVRDGAQDLPSARQLRSWRHGRLIVPAPNRKRRA